MYWVSFPGLKIGKIFLNDYAFDLFGLKIKWYGIIVAAAIVAATVFALFLMEKFGIEKEDFFGILNIGLIAGIIGARLYYFLFNFEVFSNNWLEVFNFRSGGLAIYGGLIFAVTFSFLYCKFKNIVFLPILDLASICFLLGQAIGRWGNFVNVEAFGSKTNLPWAMVSSKIAFGNQPVHPTFLYESLWCFIGFLILNFFVKHRKFDGQIILMYMVWYGFGRFFIEGLRTDSLWLIKNYLKVSQVLSLLIFLFGVIMLTYILKFYLKKHKGKSFLYVENRKK